MWPERCFTPCSATRALPSKALSPLNFRTRPGLRQRYGLIANDNEQQIGLNAAWPQARYDSSAGCPQRARIRDSQKALPAIRNRIIHIELYN
jgi:hypothetical protein